MTRFGKNIHPLGNCTGDGPSGTSSTWDYHIQVIMGDVVGDDGKVDFQDSYEVMTVFTIS